MSSLIDFFNNFIFFFVNQPDVGHYTTVVVKELTAHEKTARNPEYARFIRM